MEDLLAYMEGFVRLSPEARMAVEELAEVRHFPKNGHILEAGQHCRKIWFLSRGMVRKYHLVDGREVTTWIHVERDIFTSLESYARQTEAEEFLQACEDTVAIGISRTNSEKLSVFPEIMRFTNALMESEFVQMDRHTRAMNQLDARARYAYLREIAPEVVKRAKGIHLASVLGITRETLSRIRKA
ncbi:MAG: Crp/Fnr family transcriptional regulator [Bacteroidales bacterium]